MKKLVLNKLREIHKIGKDTRERLLHPELCPALRNYGIRLLGVSKTSEEFSFTRSHPDMLQLLVGVRGEGRVWMDGQWMPLLPGEAYLTPPHILHAYRGHRKWEVAWVMYDGDAFPDRLAKPVVRKVHASLFEHMVLGIYEECSTSRSETQLERWAELIHSQCARILHEEEPDVLTRLWSEVRQDLRYEWTLPLLAKRAGMSIEMLRLISKREVGSSPMAQVTKLRMHHALSLLEAGHKIEYIAHQVGYENAFAFSTTFKRTLGRTPSSFKK